jgi:hypothetical protein
MLAHDVLFWNQVIQTNQFFFRLGLDLDSPADAFFCSSVITLALCYQHPCQASTKRLNKEARCILFLNGGTFRSMSL